LTDWQQETFQAIMVQGWFLRLINLMAMNDCFAFFGKLYLVDQIDCVQHDTPERQVQQLIEPVHDVSARIVLRNILLVVEIRELDVPFIPDQHGPNDDSSPGYNGTPPPPAKNSFYEHVGIGYALSDEKSVILGHGGCLLLPVVYDRVA
jgi:hypothetical protein